MIFQIDEKLKDFLPADSQIQIECKKGEIVSYWFQTAYLPEFDVFDRAFSKEINGTRKKVILPHLVHDILNPQGVGYWILYNGAFVNNKTGIILYTSEYTTGEISILREELNEKFDLDFFYYFFKYSLYWNEPSI